MELLIPDTAEILATYDDPNWSNYAAITKNHYGQGSVIYLGCYPSAAVISQLVADYTQELGLRRFTAAFPVIIKQGTNDLGKTVTYYFNYSSETQLVSNPVRGTDLLSNQEVVNKLVLNPWGVAIVESV